jgi:hypothetical protein
MASANGDKKREALALALLSQPTIEAAARVAKVSESTAKRWLRADPEFLQLYRDARRQVVEGAIARLQQTCIAAVLALHKNLNCGRAATEVAAARSILEFSLRAVEVSDLAVQLAELRQAVEKMNPPGGQP